MKNLGTIAFLVVACALGMFVFAAAYLGLMFGALDWLNGVPMDGVYARELGAGIGMIAGVVGLPLGAVLAIGCGWSRLQRASGEPDWFARIAGLALAATAALLPVYASTSAAVAMVLPC